MHGKALYQLYVLAAQDGQTLCCNNLVQVHVSRASYQLRCQAPVLTRLDLICSAQLQISGVRAGHAVRMTGCLDSRRTPLIR